MEKVIKKAWEDSRTDGAMRPHKDGGNAAAGGVRFLPSILRHQLMKLPERRTKLEV